MVSRVYRALVDPVKAASSMNRKIMASLIETIFYLLTPESSLLTGFGKSTGYHTHSGYGIRGHLKIVFCVLLSIWITSMIARLV